MTEDPLRERPHEELLEIVRSLKGHIARARESVSGTNPLTLTGTAGKTREEAPPPVEETGRESLEAVMEQLRDCRRCPLCDARRTIVFGEGNPKAELLFVGEGPGEEEDRQGRPFVGRAGQLLTKIIAAMGLSRNDVYIANIVKCRPPGNRTPKPEEVAACSPFLLRQIRAIRPKVICALGSVSARFFLQTDAAVSVLRGKFHAYEGMELMVTYHPAYLLRNPNAKKQVWEDVQQIMKRYS